MVFGMQWSLNDQGKRQDRSIIRLPYVSRNRKNTPTSRTLDHESGYSQNIPYRFPPEGFKVLANPF